MDSFTKRIGSCLCVVSALVFTCSAGAADPSKVLRLGFADVEGMDPHQSTDSYSQAIQRSIFEGLYEWDYLSRPTKLFANTAVALPDITDSGKTWTIRVKPGIFLLMTRRLAASRENWLRTTMSIRSSDSWIRLSGSAAIR